MEVIPAIDIMGGRCVQLVGGRPDTKKEYGTPVEKALKWKKNGARMLHVVDLDATLGKGNNFGEVMKVKRETRLPIEFGGGIGGLEAAKKVLNALSSGDRIIVGTLAVNEYPRFETLKELGDYCERVIVSVDSRGDYVTTKGWTEDSRLKTVDLMKAAVPYVWGFLYTNVDVEGKMEGVDGERVKKVVGSIYKPVIVSGGVSTKEDIETCKSAGAWGVVLGKALYEGKVKLEDVI